MRTHPRRISPSRAALAATCLLTLAPATIGGADARLSVRVVGADGADMPARAWVQAGERRVFEPAGPATATPYRRDESFSFDGRFTVDVPAGRAVVHVERGKEYRAVERAVELAPDETRELTITLQRWIDMPSEGWYSSDMHVHFGANDERVLRQLALADDVHVTPAFTYWLRGTEPSWPDAWPSPDVIKPIVVDASHIVTRRAVEIERIHGRAAPGASVGATFLYNLRHPVTATRYGEHFPTDARLALDARRHSPEVVIDTDKPSWAETVVGAALGVYDTVQVCHNHYHRRRTITGGWGMIGPLEPGESNAAVGDGLFHRTNALYYRFLNCGFRIGVSGGSAIGVMPVPMGYNRVYAKIDGPLSAETFWSAVKAGRTFATSGPMLELVAGDGLEPGATIERDAANDEPIAVRARVRAIEALEALEIIQDGVIVASMPLVGRSAEPVFDETLRASVAPRGSGWIAARALFRAPDGLLRQAHTSPIYVRVEGKPPGRRADAVFMLRWLDRLEAIARQDGRFPTTADRDGVLADYARARAVYEGIVKRASE